MCVWNCDSSWINWANYDQLYLLLVIVTGMIALLLEGEFSPLCRRQSWPLWKHGVCLSTYGYSNGRRLQNAWAVIQFSIKPWQDEITHWGREENVSLPHNSKQQQFTRVIPSLPLFYSFLFINSNLYSKVPFTKEMGFFRGFCCV